MAFLGSCFKLLCCTHWTACSDISASKSTVPSDHWESNIRSDRQSGSLPKGHNSLRQTSCSPPNCLSKVCGVKLFLGLRLLSPRWSQSEKTHPSSKGHGQSCAERSPRSTISLIAC
jgi:hypothetical protein